MIVIRLSAFNRTILELKHIISGINTEDDYYF